MLQSAIFSTLQATETASPLGFSVLPRRSATRKGSFSRIAAWSRSLLMRNDLQRLNAHLRRDIGLDAGD